MEFDPYKLKKRIEDNEACEYSSISRGCQDTDCTVNKVAWYM
jgi:hypothetical protein